MNSLKQWLLLLVLGCLAGPALAQYQYPFQNPSLPVEQRIDNLLSLMTLPEKIHCLGTKPDVPRLGVQGTGHIEGLHGVALGGPGMWGRMRGPNGKGVNAPVFTTQFPQSVGLGETWDPALLQTAAAEEGIEARYAFQALHRGGLVVRAPNTDLARDPRWGRSEESYGEDPYFVGTMATAFVKGLQGNDPHYWLTSSLLKHFMANSNEDGRDGSSSNFDDRLMREYYSAPFRMAIEHGGSNAFMTSYNAVNNIHMTANPLLKSMVMQQWGFNGIICTDAGALTNMVTRHKYYPNMDEAAAGAIHAGINQFLDRYQQPVEGALQKRLLTEADINANLRGVFRVMIRLGMLDPASLVPYTKIQSNGHDAAPWDRPESKALARHVTQESIVLLKNTRNLLPLDKSSLKSIAVIGPRADEDDLDWYSGTPPYTITPLQGIQNKVGKAVKVSYSKDHDAAVQMARTSDVAIVLIGNHPTCGMGWGHCPDPTEGKEAFDRKQIHLNPQQDQLVRDVYAANPRTIVVLISSFPYTLRWEQQNIPAILHMAHNSEEEGNALADVLFGDYNPAGHLVVTWPKSLQQLPPMMDYNLRNGRTYMYIKGKPLYPFGYGLSYTTFRYANLHLSAKNISPTGEITASVDVTNTGTRPGEAVVQMYVQHLHSKVARPKEELKGFQRIALAAGETKTLALPLRAKSLAYWNESTNAWVVEPDTIRVKIGDSSANTPLSRKLRITQ